jgi:hypothetical protein
VKKPQVKRSIHFFVAAEITASDFNWIQSLLMYVLQFFLHVVKGE